MSVEGVTDRELHRTPSLPSLELTGERIIPGKTTQALFREHEERYVFAGQYVLGKDVLDVACGTGIGTHYLLTAGAARCYGIDIDPHAIEYAKAAYKGCRFFLGDAAEITLPDNSIDVVVSFETLEHLTDQERFLRECWRVLKPGGTLVCSTPNKRIHRWQGTNPFHVRELSADEFAALIAAQFGGGSMFSQLERNYGLHILRLMVLRALGRLKLKGLIKRMLVPGPTEKREFSEDGKDTSRQFQPYHSSLFIQPMYLVAVAHKVVGPHEPSKADVACPNRR